MADTETVSCAQCGGGVPPVSRGKPRRFCSTKCGKDFHNRAERATKNCALCGTEFVGHSKHVYCEHHRDQSSRYQFSRDAGSPQACVNCGKNFTGRRRAHCSKACWPSQSARGDGRNLEVVEGGCANCGRAFRRHWPGRGPRPTTCSKQCQKAKCEKSAGLDRGDYFPLHVKKEITAIRRLATRRHRSLADIKARRFAVLVRMHREATHACVKCGAAMPRADLRLRTCEPCTASRKRADRSLAKARRRAALRQGERVDPIRVFERDGWRCHLCGKQTLKAKRGTYHDRAPELDHVVPLSKGGQHTYANTACACRKCNIEKSDKIIGQPSLLAA